MKRINILKTSIDKNVKKQNGITLIALVITIIVLLILAAVSIAMLTGENGILTKASTAGEKNKEAEAKEKVELILQEYAIQKYTENDNFEEFLTEKEKSKDIDEYKKGTGDIWTIEVDGYAFDVNEKTLKIENYGKAGLRPKASINIITEGYVLEGNNVQFKIEVKLPEELTGATITITEPATGVAKSEEIYTVSQNGSYEFTIKANKDGKEYTTRAIATIDRILGKPTLSIKDQQSTSFTINITNNYPQEANIQYVYYVGTSESEKTTKKTYKKEGLNSGKKYTVKVRLYISDTIYVDSDDVQAETKGIEIRTVEDLKNIANDMAGGYQLMNDIDLAGEAWMNIGETNYFTGTLDGNGYVIKNMTSATTATGRGSLFYRLRNATIKNIGFENISVKSQNTSAIGDTAYNCRISNVYSTGKASGSYSSGIISYPEEGTIIENCYSTVECTGYACGGIAAQTNGSKAYINNCYSNAYIKYDSIYKGGGIINPSKAYNDTVTKSYYNKDLTTTSPELSGVTGCTTEQMKNQSTYKGWDFDNVWYMDESTGYPKLRVFKKD